MRYDTTSVCVRTFWPIKPQNKKWERHITASGSTKTTTTMEQHKGESYVWTDNEVELLLNITVEYEINKTQENAF